MESTDKEFRQIFEEHYPKILRYLLRLVGEAEAEDVSQEVFLKISRSLDKFRGEANLSTWIYRIATNAAVDHLRKSASAEMSISNGLPEEGSPDEDTLPDDGAPRLDTLLIRKDMNECIRGIVDSLPENYRTVLVLSDLEGLSNAEICEVLDLSLETVKIRLYRARQRLRKELETACDFYRDDRNELACDRKTTPLKFLKQ